MIADLANAYNETKLDTPVHKRGGARNLAVNKTHKMNTNSSEDEDKKSDQELPPLSQNHSEDNLNAATSRISKYLAPRFVIFRTLSLVTLFIQMTEKPFNSLRTRLMRRTATT